MCIGKSLKNDHEECIIELNINTTKKELFLEFWYFQYGSQVGTLSLITNSRTLIWNSSDRKKNEWIFASVYLPALTHRVLINIFLKFIK